MPGQLISAMEAARLLKISHSQVTRLCHTGVLTFQRIGNKLWIDPASIAAAKARPKVGRKVTKGKYDELLQELRTRGHERLARQIEKIFELE